MRPATTTAKTARMVANAIVEAGVPLDAPGAVVSGAELVEC
jgi:hypothetical protein